MAYLSLVILLYPTHRNKALQSWILLKSNLTDDDELKGKTMNNILAEQREIIAQLLPDFACEKHNFEEILMCELRHYVDNWPSKVAMNSVAREICLVSNCVINKTKAMILTWEKVIHLPDNDILVNLEKLIDTVSGSDELEDLLCLACLHYVLYQRKMSDVVNKNVADMNVANIPLKSTQLLKPYEEPPNPNDKCDIVPTYYNNKIENVLPLFEILDKCLNLSYTVINSNLVKNVFDLMVDFKFGEMIKQIAYEYRLQHFHNHMLRAWNLHMQYAKLTGDKIAILTSIGFILEYSDCSSNKSKQLELEAEKLIPELFESSENLEAIITYYINKSAGYLRSDFIEEGYRVFVTAQSYKNDAAIDMELDIVAARLMHLASYYMQIPCAEKLMPHVENCLNIAQNAFAAIVEYSKTNGRKCSYLLSLVLDIALDNGYLYKSLRLPREVRCYTKESVLLAQKLILPIRTAQFLSLLAFVDLLDKQYDDCEVKLSGLTKILNYGSNSTDENIWSPSLDADENVEKMSENLKTLDLECVLPMFQSVLDVPMQYRKPNTMLGSPDLRSQPFVLPKFVKHSPTCACYKCLNVEYQRLVLDSVHLESILNSYQGVLKQAQNYFNGGIMLYQKIRNKSKSFSPVEIQLGNKQTITCVFHKQLLHTSCAFLLDYSYFLTRNWDLHEAQKVVNTIVMLMDNRYHTNVFLWNEILVQKLNLMYDVTVEEANSTRYLGCELQNLLESSTTPENKMSLPKIKLSVSPLGEVNPPKAAKKIIFKLFDSDDELDSEKPKTPVVNKNQFFKIQTPGKTPAVPKIKVYSPKTVKSKRYKTVNAPNTPSVNKDTENCKSEAKGGTNNFVDKRMKLLTEKLKAETKSALKERNAIDVIRENQTKICKNLLEELEEMTDSVEGLTLENKTTKTTSRIRAKANREDGEESKKTGRSTKVEKKRRRIIVPASSSDSSSEEIGIRRSARNKTK